MLGTKGIAAGCVDAHDAMQQAASTHGKSQEACRWCHLRCHTAFATKQIDCGPTHLRGLPLA
eukprot:4254397-Amphidinium_carterae.1